MSNERKLLLMLLLLKISTFHVTESKYHEETSVRHRHRHRHENPVAYRSRHESRKSDFWDSDDNDDDYYDNYDADESTDDEDFNDEDDDVRLDGYDDTTEEDYDMRNHHFHKNYQFGKRYNYHSRTYESQRSPYRRDRYSQNRKRNRLLRSRSRNKYYRSRQEDEDYYGKRKYRKWRYDNLLDRHRLKNKGTKIHRYNEKPYGYDKNFDDDDVPDTDDDFSLEEEEDDNEGDEELDNDYFKNEEPPLKSFDEIIKRLTSNDPVNSLTTTMKPVSFKRDYRNIEIEKHLKRDAYGNLRYEPRNVSRSSGHELSSAKVSSYHNSATGSSFSSPSAAAASSSSWRPKDKDVDKNSNFSSSRTRNPTTEMIASSSSTTSSSSPGFSVVQTVSERNTQGDIKRRSHKKITGRGTKHEDNDFATKTRSLEQDYEYENTDADKIDDLIKSNGEEDSSMQADVTNGDYTEDENEEEEEESTGTLPTTVPVTTSSTTTTVKPMIMPRSGGHHRKEPKALYESGTGVQYNGYQPKNEYPPMSAHSMHKWQSLGTRESVKETRSNMQQFNRNGKSSEIREAIQHALKVSREGSCQWPRARVIPVRDVYPSPSTTYVPHCAILHRCSDDTGCCRSEALTCVPKQSHRVELYFYATSVGGSSVVEKLSFYNHTECECKERNEHGTPYDKPNEPKFFRRPSISSSGSSPSTISSTSSSSSHQPSPPPQNIRRPPQRKPCRCPSEFTPKITPEGECQCICSENDQDCIRTRRGKVYFSLTDRLCIQNDECSIPLCEFGEYMKRQGKCPRKRDKFNEISTYHTNVNNRFRNQRERQFIE